MNCCLSDDNVKKFKQKKPLAEEWQVVPLIIELNNEHWVGVGGCFRIQRFG